MLLGDGTILTGTAPDAMNASVVLSPCGVCRERLAAYGPGVLVAVADRTDPTVVVWKTLRDVLPDCWLTAFPDEIDTGRTT